MGLHWQHPYQGTVGVVRKYKATVAVNIFILFMLVSLFFQTFIIGYPLLAIYVSEKHEGVLFLHVSMAADSKNGMYFTVQGGVVIKSCRFLPRHCDAVIRSRHSSPIQFEENPFFLQAQQCFLSGPKLSQPIRHFCVKKATYECNVVYHWLYCLRPRLYNK